MMGEEGDFTRRREGAKEQDWGAIAERVLKGEVPALSILQPWPHRILWEGKDIENRNWYTSRRGPFLIHAGKSTREDPALIRTKQLPLGGIVGIAFIDGCVSQSDSPWFFGAYGFKLSGARALDLVPCLGQLGFFKPEEEVRRAVAAQLRGFAALREKNSASTGSARAGDGVGVSAARVEGR